MPPKTKKASTAKKRNKSQSESSSSSEVVNDEEERKIEAPVVSRPTPTRHSARACMAKNLADSKKERELAARREPKKRKINFDYDKLRTDKAYDNPHMYRKMKPEEFTLEYYNRTGLNEVLIFDCPPTLLGMKMVDDDFGVRDVERLVGSNKMITVVKVSTQGSVEMPLKEFVDYYCAPSDGSKSELYNVLSLEFSNSGLADLVQSPSLVRQIDWASSWPDERKTRSILFDKNGYFTVLNNFPRVENYCLMSKTQCYTDFHVDFHGTSVWYHVKKGMKIFWIVEPTEQNLKMYEEYLRSPENNAFFGDIVEKCARVEVHPGNTLIIPSGWIHGVFTPEDSLVFGGNFLHSRQAMMQLNVLQGEKRIGINKKYRYPYSEETVFFHLAKIIKAVTGRSYIRPTSKNLQLGYIEYIGELFEKEKGHQRVPHEPDYEDDGVVWQPIWKESDEYLESKKKLARWDGMDEEMKEEDGEGEGNGKEEMKDEEGSVSGATSSLNAEKEIKKENGRDGTGTEGTSSEKPLLGGHDDLFIDNYTFYHPISCNLDAGTGATAMHTLPLSENEPAITVDEDALRREIHPLDVPELEGLIAQILKRSRVDLPWGLTRPNSLLSAFCYLLRERRRLAGEEEGEVFSLPPCILPDKEGHLRLLEKQKADAAERKRKYEEKKAKEAEGEFQDADWTPDEPKKKKGRKSGGQEAGKTAPLSTGHMKKENGMECEEIDPKNKWNVAFGVWYTEQKELREKHKDMGKGKRDFVRKTYFTPMPIEERKEWLDKAIKIAKARHEAMAASTSTPSSSTPSTSAPSTSTPSSPICTPNRPIRKKKTPLHLTLDGEWGEDGMEMDGESESFPSPSPSLPPSSMTPSDPSVSGSSVTSPINLNPNLEGESAELDAAWTAFSNAHREQITAADTKVQKKHFAKKWAEMTSKGKETFFAKFGMASGARSGSMERSTPVVALVTTPKDDMVKMMRNHLMKTDDRPSTGSTVMTAEVSKYIVDSLVSLNPLYPTLVDLISTQWHSDEKKKVEIEKGLNHLVSITNTIHKRELTTEHIVHHIQELKKLAIELVNSTGRNIETVYGESVKKVMVEIAKKQNRAAQRVNSTPFLDVISVKPVDQSLLIVQPPKESSMESKSELEKKVNEKSEELKEKEKGENENEGEVLDKQSGFHEARAEPKPPEEETEEGRDEVMTSGDSIFSPSISHWRSGGMKTEELLRPYKRRQKTESLSSRGSMKEWRKEEETEEDFTSIDERSGGRKGRENHWMAMKRAQKNVRLNRYNEKPEDWTPFDVYLKKEYKSWCEEYGEEPSNALALTIKREYWSREGKFYWERRAARYRREGRKRIYWGSETVIEQEDRAVEDKGLKVVPLGGEEKVKQEHPRDEKGNLVSKNEDEYLAEDEETVVTEQSRSSQDDEMIDVEGMEEETPPIETTTTETEMMKEESTGLEEPPKKKNKGGRPKKEPLVDKKKRASLREENEDFMQSGSTPRGKAKKVKPDPNKPLIVDGVPVNPLAEPAVANAYGYDPAKDIVPLGQGQLKSAYRRSKAQLDTPQIDAKRYKLEVKHDHLLDDDDHDDTHRDESEGMDGMSRPTTPHGGVDVMEGINVHIGDGTHSSSSVGSHELPSPFPPNQRSSSFSSRRPVQPQQQAPPLIPHAPSPLAARRISGSVTDGWAGVSGGRRRSDGERRDKTPGGRSPPRKSSHFSPGEVPLTPTTPSTPSALSAAAKQTRLSQAEQFAMAAPKVIDAPRLATPLVNTPSSSSDSSLVTRSNSVSGEEPLAIDVFCSLLERITAEVERANAVMASNPNNGN